MPGLAPHVAREMHRLALASQRRREAVSHASLPRVIFMHRLDTQSLRALARSAGLGGSALRVTSDASLAAKARPRGDVRIDVAGVPPMRDRLSALSTIPVDIRRLVREKIAEYEQKAAADAAAKLAARKPLGVSERAEARSWRKTIAWVLLVIGVALAAGVLCRGDSPGSSIDGASAPS
jgi:hypothetical protein